MVQEELKGGLPLFIAGPCSIESETIAMETAEFIRGLADRFRGRAEFVFKSSFMKDNRTSAGSWAGPGLEEGLRVLGRVREEFGLSLLTDIHTAGQAVPVSRVCQIIQIPAFLCRQTSLLAAAGATGLPVNVKKGQFMAPENMKGAVDKLRETGCPLVFLTERGSFFGYGDLVVDMRSLTVMDGISDGVIMDITHSLQKPGAGMGCSGGDRSFAIQMARASAAWGITGIFLEVHPDPAAALSDSAVMLDFQGAGELVEAALASWHGVKR